MVGGCICSRGRTQALFVGLTLWLVAYRCTRNSYMWRGDFFFFMGLDSYPLRYIEVLCGWWVYLQPGKDTSFACRSDSVVGFSSLHLKLMYVER